MDGMGEEFKGSDEVLHGSMMGHWWGAGKGNVHVMGVKIVGGWIFKVTVFALPPPPGDAGMETEL